MNLKNSQKYILLLSLVLVVVSCLSPNSKEAYIEKFEQFTDRVEKNHDHYNKKDWEWADLRFEKYNKQWYLKYSDEFTVADQLRIKSCIIRYHSYKNKEDLAEILNQLFKEDVDEVREKVKNYIEKDIDEDFDKIVEGATAIGDSAVKVLEDIIKELEESF